MTASHVCACGICGRTMAEMLERVGIVSLRPVEIDSRPSRITLGPRPDEPRFWLIAEEQLEREARDDWMRAMGMV